MKPYKFLIGLLAALLFAGPASAELITMDDGVFVRPGQIGLKTDKVQLTSSGGTGILSLIMPASSGTSGTITFPASTGTISLIAGTETLTGKTLTSPHLGTSAILDQTTANYTLTWANPAAARAISFEDPLGTDIIAYKAATQTLTNKTLNGVTISGTLTGTPTMATPWTISNVNSAVNRKIVCVPLRGLAVQALDDSTVFTALIAPGRAGVLKQVSVAAITVPAGGTNTVMVKKNNTTDMLAANFDPTGLTTVVASKPALHGTAGNLAFTATDTIAVIWTAGAQSTDAVGANVDLELEITDY